MADYDRSSKWLIQHYGDAILRLAGVRDVVRWRAVHSELVQPGQLPDGLIEAERAGKPEPTPFVIEIATYPERRLEEQLLRDTLLVVLARRTVPSVVAVILRPKGRLRVAESVSLASPDGLTRVDVHWRIVELWKVPAEELLAAGDPGLMPWVPLARSDEPPRVVLRRCREVIDTVPSEEERS